MPSTEAATIDRIFPDDQPHTVTIVSQKNIRRVPKVQPFTGTKGELTTYLRQTHIGRQPHAIGVVDEHSVLVDGNDPAMKQRLEDILVGS